MLESLLEFLIQGLVLALLEWDRKSELSADRAGLLACQDLESSQRLLVRTAGPLGHATTVAPRT